MLLFALTEELSRVEGLLDNRNDSLRVNAAFERLQSSPLFQRALQQLLSREVQVGGSSLAWLNCSGMHATWFSTQCANKPCPATVSAAQADLA